MNKVQVSITVYPPAEGHTLEPFEMEMNKTSNYCVTCNKIKDPFSLIWDYAQCQECSMKEGENE